MITKKTLTRQSIDELAKVCPGVTVPERAMSTIYGCGDGSYDNPFTWDEYKIYKASGQSSPISGSGGVYYYDMTGNRVCDVDDVTVIGQQTEEERRRAEERRKKEAEERRRAEEARLRMDMLWLNLYNGVTGNIDYNPPSGNDDNNHQNPGAGGTNPQPKFTRIELTKQENFVGYDVSGDCMTGAQAIMAKYKLKPAPAKDRKEFVTANGVASADVVAAAMKVVDTCLSKGQPCIAGVRIYNRPNRNGEQYANHFVVITGRGTDGGRLFFTYMETGVSDPSIGCNIFANRFYYNENTRMWVDEYSGYDESRSGTLTEFRPNL